MATGTIERPLNKGSFMSSIGLNSNETITLTFNTSGNTRFLIFSTGAGGTNPGRGLYLAGNVSAATVAYTEAVPASGLAVSRSSNTLSIKNNTEINLAILILMFYGDMPTYSIT